MTRLLTDAPSFVDRLELHRSELHVHCYRMLASFDAAGDLVEETFAQAQRQRDRLDNGSWFRAWLYRIATNACLDVPVRGRRRTCAPVTPADLPWVQPYPDRLLDEVAAGDDRTPMAIPRETIELSYIVALQLLPPRQRAALILRDVLGWSLRETAGLLDTSIVAADSALQRARSTFPSRLGGPDGRSAVERAREERALLHRHVGDLTRTDRPGEWRVVPTAANRQPAAACYLRRSGSASYQACQLDVLRVDGATITEVATFDAHVFPSFALPLTL
jgi:RNA polymerase sigma-70 factor (ECF subfamily)